MIANDNMSGHPHERVEPRPARRAPDWFGHWSGRRVLRLANDNARGQGRRDEHDVATGREMGPDLGEEDSVWRARINRRARQLIGRLKQMYRGRCQIGGERGGSVASGPLDLTRLEREGGRGVAAAKGEKQEMARVRHGVALA
ncbi:hypothetical protein [Methylobacterium segetis]|uniref:hypothetical protein n=1 Tax=Methylobacterium segetis TaxID=2488750 RepID=UPI00105286EA|nr:hypothetical protein [Methylobacterium segetis]